MLARAARLVSAADYRNTVRRGRRASGSLMTVTALPTTASGSWRFGFIVARTVGNAVVRNRVRRRLKGICFSLLPVTRGAATGFDVVARAHPPAAVASFSELDREFRRLVSRTTGLSLSVSDATPAGATR